MSTIDWGIIAVALVGLGIWVRGCARKSAGDCWLGMLVGVVACGIYFFMFSLTRSAYLALIMWGVFLVAMLPFRKVLLSGWGKALLGTAIVMAAASAVLEYKILSMGNALLVIEPYRSGKVWRFDEPRLRLKGEPFVQGVPEMIDKMVAGIPGAENSVRLIFSQRSFPGAQYRLDRRREQDGGNWYYSEQYQMEGWLCPALFKFFPRAPRHIYVRAEAK